jgi:selenoprotein W-related protein
LAAELKQAFPECDVQLLESSGGAFEVEVDGALLFSKRSLGRHAESGEILSLIQDSRD